jgi:hypothetical protein
MDLEGFLLMRTTTSRMPQLVLQWESFFTDANSSTGNPDPIPAPNISLCQAALVALSLLLHVEIPASEIVSNRECVPKFARLSPYSEALQKVGEILAAERAHSLTLAKALLEYMYWVRGSDILQLEDPDSNQELEEDAVRQWLEAERAAKVQHFIKSLLREKHNLDVLEQYHVLFLLQTSIKQITDAHHRLKQYSSEVIL